MKYRLAWILGVVFLFSGITYGAQAQHQQSSYTGVVTTISEGILYIGGVAYCIATVSTVQGAKRVAVPTMGVMQPLQVGESLSFSGPAITVNSDLVINTREGFIFRMAEKSMATYMADMNRQMQAKAQTQAREAEKSGVPNAVPIMLMESQAQVEQSGSKRRTDILLTLLSLITALLAIERIQHFAVAPVRWIRTRFAKRITPSEKNSST